MSYNAKKNQDITRIATAKGIIRRIDNLQADLNSVTNSIKQKPKK